MQTHVTFILVEDFFGFNELRKYFGKMEVSFS